MEYVDNTTFGNGFTAVGNIGRDNHHIAGSNLFYFTVEIEFHFTVDEIGNLLMMMRMIGQGGPGLDTPIRKGHVIGMNKLYMKTGY